ncbi:MAG: plastocyanin/azurin family copper-binding protein [Actinomycetota bacterium]
MRHTRLLPFVASALLVASACASGTSTSSKQAGKVAVDTASATLAKAITVHLPKSYKFEPDVAKVAAGAVVTWINQDDFPHTVRLLDGSGVDKQLGVGDETSITFEKAGVFRYDCSLHPTQMKGQVIVEETSS